MLNLVKFAYERLILGLSQFLLLPLLPQKTILPSKVVKRESKIIILFLYSKSVTSSLYSPLFSSTRMRQTSKRLELSWAAKFHRLTWTCSRGTSSWWRSRREADSAPSGKGNSGSTWLPWKFSPYKTRILGTRSKRSTTYPRCQFHQR